MSVLSASILVRVRVRREFQRNMASATNFFEKRRFSFVARLVLMSILRRSCYIIESRPAHASQQSIIRAVRCDAVSKRPWRSSSVVDVACLRSSSLPARLVRAFVREIMIFGFVLYRQHQVFRLPMLRSVSCVAGMDLVLRNSRLES